MYTILNPDNYTHILSYSQLKLLIYNGSNQEFSKVHEILKNVEILGYGCTGIFYTTQHSDS